MRECWINAYPDIDAPGAVYLGLACKTPDRANSAATGFEQVEPGELRRMGVGYRLHVRLKPEWREHSPPGIWRELVAS